MEEIEQTIIKWILHGDVLEDFFLFLFFCFCFYSEDIQSDTLI